MASHNELKGTDLHEPSRLRIINLTGVELVPGDWVFLKEAANSNGFIEVTRLAGALERVVGLITDEGIASGNTGTALTFGRISFNTETLAEDSLVGLNSAGDFTAVTDPLQAVGTIVLAAAAGIILIDTLTIPIANTGSPTSLGALSDVTLGVRADGQILVFDSATNMWINQEDANTGNIDNIELGGTGIVTVTFNDGTPDLQFQAGQRLLVNGIEQTYHPNKNFIGSINVVDGADMSDIYMQVVEPEVSDLTGSAPVIEISTVNNQSLAKFKGLRNTDSRLTVDVDATNPEFINIDSPTLNSLVDTTEAGAGINNLADVEINNPVKDQVLRYVEDLNGNITLQNASGGGSTVENLEDLKDVYTSGEAEGQLLELVESEAEMDIVFASTLRRFAISSEPGLLFSRSSSNSLNIDIDQFEVRYTFDDTAILPSAALNRSDSEIILDILYNTSDDGITDEILIDGVVEFMNADIGAGGFDNVTGVEREHTFGIGDDYYRRGTWSKETNPRHNPGSFSVGRFAFEDLREGGGENFGEYGARLEILGRPAGNINFTTIFPGGTTTDPDLQVDGIVTTLNGITDFSNHYVASRFSGTNDAYLVITALVANSNQDASNVQIIVAGDGSNNYTLADGTLTGGSEADDEPFVLRWVNTGILNDVEEPTIDGITAELAYTRGGLRWQNNGFPKIFETIENLADVDVTDKMENQVLVSDISSPRIQVGTFSDTSSLIFEIEDNLVIAPYENDTGPPMGKIQIILNRGQAAESVNYNFDGDILTVTINFMDTSIEIVTQNNAIALALGVNWGDGLSVDGVRTFPDHGDYIRRGTWELVDDPSAPPASVASTTVKFTIDVPSGVIDNPTENNFIIFSNLEDYPALPAGFNRNILLPGVTSATNTIDTWAAQVKPGLDANSSFSQYFTISNPTIDTANRTATFTLTTTMVGSEWNGTFGLRVANSAGDPDGSFLVEGLYFRGGADEAFKSQLAQWTDPNTLHTVSSPQLISGHATIRLLQGGNVWVNKNFELENLSDVDLTIDPNRAFKQIMKLGLNDTEWKNEADILENQDDVTVGQDTALATGDKLKRAPLLSGDDAWVNTPDVLENINDVRYNGTIAADEALVFDGVDWVNRFYRLFNLSDTNFANPNITRPDGTGIVWDTAGSADGMSGAWVEQSVPSTAYFGVRTRPGTLDQIPSNIDYGSLAQSAMYMIGDNLNSAFMTLTEEDAQRTGTDGVVFDYQLQILTLQPGKYRFSGVLGIVFVGPGSNHDADVVMQLRYGSDKDQVRDHKIQDVTGTNNNGTVDFVNHSGVESRFESGDILVPIGVGRNNVALDIAPTIVEFTEETFFSIFFHTDLNQSFDRLNILVEQSQNYPLGLEITRLGD